MKTDVANSAPNVSEAWLALGVGPQRKQKMKNG
jgi:hypothetical protein